MDIPELRKEFRNAKKVSSKRVLHYAVIDDVSDITKELLFLLKESYNLVKGTV